MYSLVLMAALTTGGQTPDLCFHRSCGGYNCGCYACWGCGGCHGYTGSVGSPYAPGDVVPGTVMPPAPEGTKKEEGGARVDPNRARLVVEVPANAKLFIDDQPMKSSAATRVFNTPKLEKGQTYYYEVKVEVARDGVMHSETRKVLVRAGERARAV